MAAWSRRPYKAVSAALSFSEGAETSVPTECSVGGALFGEQSLSRAGIGISIIVKRAAFDLADAIVLEAHGDAVFSA